MLTLLFFLLCAVTGSVILAAATASAGRAAGLSGSRQNYQSVEAAARLLETELHGAEVILTEREDVSVQVERETKTDENGEESEESWTTTSYHFSGPDFMDAADEKTEDTTNETGTADSEGNAAAAFSEGNGRNASLSLLEQLLTDADISTYLLKGETYEKAGSIVISERENEGSEDAAALLSECEDAWHEGFLTGSTEKYKTRHFTLTPEGEEAAAVKAELRLYGDGTLEIRLSNAGGAEKNEDTEENKADRYYMLLRGRAELRSTSRSERMDTEAEDSEGSESRITKTTRIRWQDFTITKNAAEVGGREKETTE